jgi:hypothetical protein
MRESERQELYRRANDAGFLDVAAYIRTILFDPEP